MGRSKSRKSPSKRHAGHRGLKAITMKRVSVVQSQAAKKRGGMTDKGSHVAKLQSRLAKYALANQKRVCQLRRSSRYTHPHTHTHTPTHPHTHPHTHTEEKLQVHTHTHTTHTHAHTHTHTHTHACARTHKPNSSQR